MKKKISIIIPAYNVANFVEKCLLSCLDQDLPQDELEIIVVNDGSTDTTTETVKRVQARNPNIVLISISNEGPGHARNIGIEAAVGEYVWFVDSDDWIEKNCLSELYSIASTNDLDMLWFQLGTCAEGDEKITKKEQARSNSREVLVGSQFLNTVMGFSAYAVLFLIRRDFLIASNQRFQKGIYYEDLEFIPRLILEAQRVKYEPTVFYYYFLRSKSIIQSINPKKIDDLPFVILSLRATGENYGVLNKDDFLNLLISKMIIDSVRLVSNINYKDKQMQFINILIEHDLKKVRVFGPVSQRIQAILYNISPLLYLRFCTLLRTSQG